jgi:hypothetical protein
MVESEILVLSIAPPILSVMTTATPPTISVTIELTNKSELEFVELL